MHELKEFVDNGLEEFPVSSEKTWVLADNIHDVRGYNCLIVFAPLLLNKPK